MSDTAVSMAVYAGLGLIVAVVIFIGALWFANAAKKGSLRFKWRQRRSQASKK